MANATPSLKLRIESIRREAQDIRAKTDGLVLDL